VRAFWLAMASSRSGGGPSMRALELEKMSVEQLKAVKEQADLEVNLLQDSLNNVRTATSRLELASSALQDLSLRPQGPHSLSTASLLFSPLCLLQIFLFFRTRLIKTTYISNFNVRISDAQ